MTSARKNRAAVPHGTTGRIARGLLAGAAGFGLGFGLGILLERELSRLDDMVRSMEARDRQ